MEKAQPKQKTEPEIDHDSKSELIDRKIDMADDGSVVVIETIANTTRLSSREFVSWMRKHEETRRQIKEVLSDKVREATEKELEKVEEDILKLKPDIDESEKRAKAHYEQLKTNGMIKTVAEELDKPMSDINLDYMNQVWQNLVQNEQQVLNALSDDQKKKFLKIKIRFMAKNRGRR